MVAEALEVSLDKPLEWAVGSFFGNTEPSLELWTVITGISGFDKVMPTIGWSKCSLLAKSLILEVMSKRQCAWTKEVG